MSKTYKVNLERNGGTDVSTFIGKPGDLFWDPENFAFRVGNGTPGGTQVGFSSGANDVGDSDYVLQLSDANKTILAEDNTIQVPRDDDVNFPIGTIITIVAKNYGVRVYRQTYEEGDPASVHYVDGTGSENVSVWLCSAYSICSLIKTDANYWYLSGPSISNDD